MMYALFIASLLIFFYFLFHAFPMYFMLRRLVADFRTTFEAVVADVTPVKQDGMTLYTVSFEYRDDKSIARKARSCIFYRDMPKLRTGETSTIIVNEDGDLAVGKADISGMAKECIVFWVGIVLAFVAVVITYLKVIL